MTTKFLALSKLHLRYSKRNNHACTYLLVHDINTLRKLFDVFIKRRFQLFHQQGRKPMYDRRLVHQSNLARQSAITKALQSGRLSVGNTDLAASLYPFWEEFVFDVYLHLKKSVNEHADFSRLAHEAQVELHKDHPLLNFNYFLQQFQETCLRFKNAKCS